MHPEAAHEIFAPRHRAVLRDAPVFVGADLAEFQSYLASRIPDGGGLSVLDEIRGGRFRPQKTLLAHTAQAIRNERVWELLDEQRVSFNAVLTRRARGCVGRLANGVPDSRRPWHGEVGDRDQPARGAFGAWRRVIARHRVAGLHRKPPEGRRKPGSRPVQVLQQPLQRRRRRTGRRDLRRGASAPGVQLELAAPKRFRTDVSQVEELVRAARTSVFFIDDLQVVRPAEVGSSELIRDTAQRLDCELIEFELEAQFRCAGSEEFVQWVENTLEIRRTPVVMWDTTNEFEFALMDSPGGARGLGEGEIARTRTARLTAGFCWPWSNPLPTDRLVDDVVFGEWAMPWNAKPELRASPAGNPEIELLGDRPRGHRASRVHLHRPGIRVRLRRRHLRPRSRLSPRRRLGWSAFPLPRQRREAGREDGGGVRRARQERV